MATILRTTQSDYHGNVTVTEKVLSPSEVGTRGTISRKRVAAYAAGRGRRNRSAYQAKALGSGRGVLARPGTQFTKDPIHTVTQVHPAGLPQCAKNKVSETAYIGAFPTGA